MRALVMKVKDLHTRCRSQTLCCSARPSCARDKDLYTALRLKCGRWVERCGISDAGVKTFARLQVEKEIDRLQKKKTQLEENSKQPPEPEKDDTSQQRVEPKHRDLWQVIYAENRVRFVNHCFCVFVKQWFSNCGT